MKKTIVLTDEARAAIKRKAPSDKRLVEILLDNNEDTMPTPTEARYLALQELVLRGYQWKRE
jgi:hypothetical protein